MSSTDAFFDALEKRILAGEKLGAMKHFLIDARDRFLKFEQDAQASVGKTQTKGGQAQIKKALAENERLEAELDKLRQEIERLGFDNNQLRKAAEKEHNPKAQKPYILKPEAMKILEVIAECGEQNMSLLRLNLKMKESTIQHHLNEMLDAGLLLYLAGSDGSAIWMAGKEGLALFHESASERSEQATKDKELERLKSEMEKLRVMNEALKVGELGRNKAFGIFAGPTPQEKATVPEWKLNHIHPTTHGHELSSL